MIEPIRVAGSSAWLKRYGHAGARRFRLAALDLFARRLELSPLRPPPHHAGRAALAVERRRLDALRARGVRVPEVLGVGENALLLSDIGPTLASRMREAANDPVALDALTLQAIDAIGAGHARGAHFGQPWPRNLTVGEDGVGFLDFEEDPCEVMPLHDAQARDWVFFTYGAARYYRGRRAALASLGGDALARLRANVATTARQVGERLEPLARVAGRVRHPASRTVARAIRTLRTAAPLLLAMAIVLGLDLVHDGEIDLFELLS